MNAARRKTRTNVKETSPPGVQVITTSNIIISANEMLKDPVLRELHLQQVERVEPVQPDVH